MPEHAEHQCIRTEEIVRLQEKYLNLEAKVMAQEGVLGGLRDEMRGTREEIAGLRGELRQALSSEGAVARAQVQRARYGAELVKYLIPVLLALLGALGYSAVSPSPQPLAQVQPAGETTKVVQP